MPLSNDEIRRYSRHLIMPEIGMQGQEKLKNASVLCIGAGGLGSPLSMYLAAAGVGRLGLVDFDVVDFTNLHRQVIHGTKDVGRPKLDSARDRLRDINPEVKLEPHEIRLDSSNSLDLFRKYDIVADGTDNFPTRYLVNDACVLTGRMNVYASIFRFEGQVSVFGATKRNGPCYRCWRQEPPPPGSVPSCAEGGVLGVLPGIVGTIQATEVIKLITGIGEPLIGRLLTLDALAQRHRTFKIRKDPNCPVCGTNPTVKTLIDYVEFCGVPHEEQGTAEVNVTPDAVKDRLDRKDDFLLVDVREPHEWEICHIEGARLLPLSELPARMNELDTAQEIVLHCKLGQRSLRALAFLRSNGFRKLKNMVGGIDRWAQDVDPDMPRY